jgi:carbon monoxide dehydrogenase subunit G
MSMETRFDLSEDGDGTEMRWEADVRILGQVASMGQRVVQPIVNQQVEQVLNALDARVAAKGA